MEEQLARLGEGYSLRKACKLRPEASFLFLHWPRPKGDWSRGSQLEISLIPFWGGGELGSGAGESGRLRPQNTGVGTNQPLPGFTCVEFTQTRHLPSHGVAEEFVIPSSL